MLRAMARPKEAPPTEENLSRWHDESVWGYDSHPDYQGGRLFGSIGADGVPQMAGARAFSRFRVRCIEFFGPDNADLVAWATDPELEHEASMTRLAVMGAVANLAHRMLDVAGCDWTEAVDLLVRVNELSRSWDARSQQQGRASDLRAMVAHAQRLASVQWRCMLEEERGVDELAKQHSRQLYEHMLRRSFLPAPLDTITREEWLELATAWRPPILRNTKTAANAVAWKTLHRIATAEGRRITTANSWKSARDMYRAEIRGQRRKPSGAIG